MPVTEPAAGSLRVAGAASIAAGAVHAAAAGAHGEHPRAVWLFAVVAAVQVGWGIAALRRPGRRVAGTGAGLAGAALAGWAMAKTSGLPGIAGLDRAEALQAADAIAAALAAVTLGACLLPLVGRGLARRAADAAMAAAAVVALAGVVAAGTHDHGNDHLPEAVAGGPAGGHADSDHDPGDGDDATATAPRPYDPALPIDLGGVEGVTPEQQARAENLVAVTLLRLPRFADPAVAEAHGYHSIGDEVTGYEHYVNRSLIDDGVILDPDVPESLVYQVRDGEKQLVAAMFMLPPGEALDTVPDIGGRLTQWHIHDNLCYTPDPVAPKVAALTRDDGTCPPPLVKGLEVPMIHVWIVPHPCGPFAALEGIAGGQIAAGEERWCDHAHGSA